MTSYMVHQYCRICGLVQSGRSMVPSQVQWRRQGGSGRRRRRIHKLIQQAILSLYCIN
jgi:hypothetical protein